MIQLMEVRLQTGSGNGSAIPTLALEKEGANPSFLTQAFATGG